MNHWRHLRTIFFIFSAILFATNVYSKSVNFLNNRDNPSVVIHDTVIGPGELLLQMDALNFVGDNGQVSAISLKIAVDTNLLQFIGIQNTTLFGSWLANYNVQQNEITIIYTAYSGNGYDINGKLLDLHLFYNAGFDASLHFKDGCEISNVYLQSIDSVEYVDGLIEQTSPEGVVGQDSVTVNYGEVFSMPVIAGGVGYDSVNEVFFRIGYDDTQLQFQSVSAALFTGITVVDSNSVVTCQWSDTSGFYDLTTTDTLFYLNFIFTGDTVATTHFLPGSKILSNGNIVPSLYQDGAITARYWLELKSNPDTAGITTGAGFYFSGDTVTVSAESADWFDFSDWVRDDSIVSYDSVYTFVMNASQDTLTAVFKANTFSLLLVSVPADGGTTTGDGDYQYGDSVTVVADANPGYDFVAWTFGDDTLSFDSAYTFVMPHNNLVLTANFRIQTFLINASSNNPDYGSVTGGGQYNYGDSCYLIATANPYYNFIVWTENGQAVSYDSAYSFQVFSDRDLVANFQYDAACSAPVGLFVDSLSDSTAMLHWLSSGEEEEWDLLWGNMGFDTASAGQNVMGLTEMHYFLENLTAGSSYDYYVRAVCTDQIHSTWAGPYTFTTWYVGVHENAVLSSFLLFPNPAQNRINVYFNKHIIYSSIRFEIVNLNGVSVISGETDVNHHASINIKTVESGVYFLKLYLNNKTISKIFIKR